jgi:hypothetical protein
MDNIRSWFLTGYLLAVVLLTAYLVCSLWSARASITVGQIPVPKCATNGNALLSNLYPDKVSVGSSSSDFLIVGCGFSSTTQVKFNGTQHAALFVDASHIRTGFTNADISAPGTVVVTLSQGGIDIGSGVLKISPPEVDWRFLGLGPIKISLEIQLLILVFLIGAFSSSIYALKSLADYKGDDHLYVTWFIYYLIQPCEGAGSAFLLYLVIRGGFLTGISGENQFGICAIAGLAGAFSDTVFLKLREIFQTLFKPEDDRGGKLTLKITTSSLPNGTVGNAYKQALETIRGTSPYTWSVTPSLPATLSLDRSTGIIIGTPAAVSAGTYKFTVTDSATPPQSADASLTLEIK